MKKVMIVLFYIDLICWVSFGVICCIVRMDLFKTLFLIFNTTTIFFGAWISGYYFRNFEYHQIKITKLLNDEYEEDHSLDLLKNAKMISVKPEQENHDEIAHTVEAQRIYAQSKNEKVCKKCVNCKYRKDNRCIYYDGYFVRNINLYTSCRHFERKDTLK